MKKLIAILMMLCLFAGVAMAETAEINWADIEPSVEQMGLEGEFVAVGDLGIAMFVPAGFQEVELSEEEIQQGFLSYLTNEDQSAVVSVTYANVEGASLEEYAAALPELGAADIDSGLVNGIPMISYAIAENDSRTVAVTTTEGYIVEFTFAPMSDENMNVLTSIMVGSIQPIEE